MSDVIQPSPVAATPPTPPQGVVAPDVSGSVASGGTGGAPAGSTAGAGAVHGGSPAAINAPGAFPPATAVRTYTEARKLNGQQHLVAAYTHSPAAAAAGETLPFSQYYVAFEPVTKAASLVVGLRLAEAESLQVPVADAAAGLSAASHASAVEDVALDAHLMHLTPGAETTAPRLGTAVLAQVISEAESAALTEVASHLCAAPAYRKGRRIQDMYCIVSAKLVLVGQQREPVVLVSVYHNSTSFKHTSTVNLTDMHAVIASKRLSEQQVPVPVWVAVQSLLSDDDKRAATGAPESSNSAWATFFGACADHIAQRDAVTIVEAVEKAIIAAANAEKDAGNRAFIAKDFTAALASYTRAMSMTPANLVYRLNRAAAFVETDAHDEAIADCKFIVSACRQLERDLAAANTAGDVSAAEKLQKQEAVATAGQGTAALVAKAYARIGSVFMRQNVFSRASNAFTLSLSAKEDESVRAKLLTCLDKIRGTDSAASSQDIEDIVSHHTLLRGADKMKFECTGCGECCRHADNLFMSPADLFRMSRSPAMNAIGVKTTGQLRQQFKDAIKFVYKDFVPVAQLRPARTRIGQCHFAYPLYKKPDGSLLSFEEVHKSELKAYKPVESWEYNLTPEEEAAALQGIAEGDEGVEEDKDGASDGEHRSSPEPEPSGAAGDAAGEQRDEPTPEEVMNSFGRQALGCMFGIDHMPAICATYPMAREMTFADFWHAPVAPVAPAAAAAAATSADAAGTDDAASLALIPDNGQRYVVVKSDGCEGFFEDGRARTDALGTSSLVAAETTVDDFIQRNDIAIKWDHHDSFVRLVNSVVRTGCAAKLNERMPVLHHEFAQAIGRIWFDFDSLPSAKDRPYRSYGRVHHVIASLTQKLVQATETYLATTPAPAAELSPEEATSIVESFKQVVRSVVV